MIDTPLLDWRPPEPRGETFDLHRDGPRLSAQARRVFSLMSDGNWWTLATLSEKTGDPEASISARIRDLDKAGYGKEHEFVARGLWRYRLTKNLP